MCRARAAVWISAVLTLVGTASGQQFTVTARVEGAAPGQSSRAPRNVVVWLTPAEGAVPVQLTQLPEQRPSLTQKNKAFVPHLLVVQVGTVVDFPNHDPFFHNVFSLFEGKRFDLGLYEAGATRHVRFDRPGVCYIFCNIHPEMSAVVVVLDTPYYGVTDRKGMIAISGVPQGRYTMHVWDERALPDTLAQLTREVSIGPGQQFLGGLQIPETEGALAHKNKYGQDYEKPTPPGAGYIPQ